MESKLCFVRFFVAVVVCSRLPAYEWMTSGNMLGRFVHVRTTSLTGWVGWVQCYIRSALAWFRGLRAGMHGFSVTARQREFGVRGLENTVLLPPSSYPNPPSVTFSGSRVVLQQYDIVFFSCPGSVARRRGRNGSIYSAVDTTVRGYACCFVRFHDGAGNIG